MGLKCDVCGEDMDKMVEVVVEYPNSCKVKKRVKNVGKMKNKDGKLTKICRKCWRGGRNPGKKSAKRTYRDVER